MKWQEIFLLTTSAFLLLLYIGAFIGNREKRKRLREAQEASLQMMWAAWWARNAGEANDHHTEPLYQLAIATLLAPSMEQVRVELLALVPSYASPDGSNRFPLLSAREQAFFLALGELHAAKLPWTMCDEGRPLHVRALLDRAFQRVLTS